MADEAIGIKAMLLRLAKLDETGKPLLQDYLKSKNERKRQNDRTATGPSPYRN